jgi:hypothetical protein
MPKKPTPDETKSSPRYRETLNDLNNGTPSPLVFLEQTEAAAVFKISPRTLETYRLTGKGPVFTKIGSRVLYQLRDLYNWADRNKHTSTTDEK